MMSAWSIRTSVFVGRAGKSHSIGGPLIENWGMKQDLAGELVESAFQAEIK